MSNLVVGRVVVLEMSLSEAPRDFLIALELCSSEKPVGNNDVKALRVSFYLKHLDMLFGIPISSQLSKAPRFSLGVVSFNENQIGTKVFSVPIWLNETR